MRINWDEFFFGMWVTVIIVACLMTINSCINKKADSTLECIETKQNVEQCDQAFIF